MIEKKVNLVPSKEYFSTGEAAELCSVTPDTVLKWIRAGKLHANRTPGGHHRIPRSALLPILQGEMDSVLPPERQSDFQYCWEFYTVSGAITEGCEKCLVYRSRTRRCYEMKDLPPDAGYLGLLCDTNCEKCDYYVMMYGEPDNILVVTDQTKLKDELERGSKNIGFKLRLADSEYKCSMLIDKFRPDYVVIDCSLGTERCERITKLLDEDPRIPFVRIILAGKREDLPRDCDRMIYALIDKHFTAMMLSELIGDSQSSASETS